MEQDSNIFSDLIPNQSQQTTPENMFSDLMPGTSSGSNYPDRVKRIASENYNNFENEQTKPFVDDKSGPEWLQKIGDVGGRMSSMAGSAAQGILSPGTAAIESAANSIIPSVARGMENAIDDPRFKASNITPEKQEKLARDIGQVGTQAVMMPPELPEAAWSKTNAIANLANATDKPPIMGYLRNSASGSPDITPPVSLPKNRNYDQIKEANNNLSDTTSEHYQKAEQLGATLTPEASQFAKDKLKNDVGDDLDPGLHPQTIGALRLFDKKADNGLDWQSIDNTRKKLNMIAYDSNANANDIGAAKQAVKSIDSIFDGIQQDPSMLSSGTPDAIDALKDARQASATEQRHATIAQILRKANNNPNAIQSGFKSLYDDEDEFNRFAPDDQALIKDIAHPSKLVSNLQTIGKAGPGGNGTINLAEAASILSGNPIAMGIAGTGAAVGAGANVIRSNLVRSSAEKLLQNIESKSVPVTPIKAPPIDDEYNEFSNRNGFKRGGAVKEPTPAQKMAGNYKKHHVRYHGMDISIENLKNSERHGVDKDGKKWSAKMPDHYGYIRRTQGADGDHVDVYLGNNVNSNRVYVIDQKHHDTGTFDEHKCMLGYSDRDAAVKAYRSAFSDKKNRIMKVTRLNIDEFKDWLKHGDTRKPVKKLA